MTSIMVEYTGQKFFDDPGTIQLTKGPMPSKVQESKLRELIVNSLTKLFVWGAPPRDGNTAAKAEKKCVVMPSTATPIGSSTKRRLKKDWAKRAKSDYIVRDGDGDLYTIVAVGPRNNPVQGYRTLFLENASDSDDKMTIEVGTKSGVDYKDDPFYRVVRKSRSQRASETASATPATRTPHPDEFFDDVLRYRQVKNPYGTVAPADQYWSYITSVRDEFRSSLTTDGYEFEVQKLDGSLYGGYAEKGRVR